MKTHDPSIENPQVPQSGGRKAPSTRRLTGINWASYRWLIDAAGITNLEMARATGMSESYATQVGSGTRVRVNVDFLDRAAVYIAARLSEPMVITRILLTKG